MSNQRLKKGDQVLVTTGKDKGKTGIISKIYADKNRVLITGINMVKKPLSVIPKRMSPARLLNKKLPFIFPMLCSSIRAENPRASVLLLNFTRLSPISWEDSRSVLALVRTFTIEIEGKRFH